jgi:hypothetical protein
LDLGDAVKAAGLLLRRLGCHREQERPGGLPGQQSRRHMAVAGDDRLPACDQAYDH